MAIRLSELSAYQTFRFPSPSPVSVKDLAKMTDCARLRFETPEKSRRKTTNGLLANLVNFLLLGMVNFKCPGRDSNSYNRRSPPPQDGASTNFATWAKTWAKIV